MATLSENLTREMSYRRFDDDTTSLSDADIPLRPENRRSTDKYWLVVFILSILILMPFLVYTLVHSDIDRLGMSTVSSTESNRYNQDILDDLYESDESINHRLNARLREKSFDDRSFQSSLDKVFEDPEEQTVPSRYSRSVTWEKKKDTYVDFSVLGWRLAFATLISLGLCIFLAFMLRYATDVTVWGILILSLIVIAGYTAFLWTRREALGSAIALSITTVVLLILMIFMKDKIRLAIMLFKEATKATFQMHMVFAVPALTIVLILMIVIAYVTTTIYMSTAGYITSKDLDKYVPDNWMVAGFVLNFFVTLWVVEFLAGIQYMIVSGAVTKWYFSRNKDMLGSPVYTSMYVTIVYHLGTIAVGSLIITLVTILRMILRSMARNPRLRWLVDCLMGYIETFLRFFTKNSYIVTAMHGTSFIQSGKQAVKLFTLNICNTIAISSIGDFVITMCYVFVVVLSVLFAVVICPQDESYEAYLIFIYLFVFATSLLTCYTILGTFETAFSTLFLCVCQDFLMNNGADKPYAMTRDLMEYLEASKKLYAKQIEAKNLPTI